MTDETNPQDFVNKRRENYSHIKGWGVDIDPKNDPTYPMKKRTDDEIKGYSWERPPLQPVNIEVLKSVERPNITAVFGTSVPPKGLSGLIRRNAFKYSENSYGRWLPLVLADRIGVIEGYIEDFSNGTVPNIFAERGWKAEMKYNRKNFLMKAAAIAAVTSAAFIFMATSRNRN